MKPVLEGIGEALKSVNTTMGVMVEKMTSTEKEKTTETESETETDKEDVIKSAEVNDVLNTLAQGLLDTQKQLVDVAKSVDSIKQVTPKQVEREEKTEVEKSADKNDKNSCFDSVMPFLGKPT